MKRNTTRVSSRLIFPLQICFAACCWFSLLASLPIPLSDFSSILPKAIYLVKTVDCSDTKTRMDNNINETDNEPVTGKLSYGFKIEL